MSTNHNFSISRKISYFALFIFILANKNVLAEIKFHDVSSASGIDHIGESFGASWGDFNGDGLPDLWASNHRYHPSLYINQGNGEFIDIAESVIDYVPGDTHGAAWGDYDNDGDQDLIELAGGGGGLGGPIWPGYRNHLFENENGDFTEKGVELGVDYPQARGRTPTWVDWNKDGLLDVVLTSYAQPDLTGGTALFQQETEGFRSVNDETGFGCDKRTSYAQQADLNGDGRMEVICHKAASFPDRIYDLSYLPFVNYASPDIKQKYTKDSVIVDLDGDLDLDMFLARSDYIASNAIKVGYRQLESKLEINADEKGFDFQTSGSINVTMFMPRMADDEIYVGANGNTPANIVHEPVPALNKSILKFTLSFTDPENVGIANHAAGVDKGIYFGYDTSAGVWKVRLSHSQYNLAHIQIESTSTINNIEHVGFSWTDNNKTPVVLKNVNGELVDVSAESGFTEARFCESIGAGDFDNDMDIDLYFVCSVSALINAPNVIAENMGDGTFIVSDHGHGAEAVVPGVAETVAVADYDEDGFLDLFVANGRSGPPFSSDGKDLLFHNAGNNNHWLHIDLEGIESNRNGVGARIYATAGGVTQLREQNGGIHRFSQDHQRIHFGLGGNDIIERLVVHWPSGIVQELKNIQANQVIKITEPTVATTFGKPSDYVPGKVQGVFIWQDAINGRYHLRVSSDGVDSTFDIKVITEKPILSLTKQSIENNDKMLELENGFTLTSHVAGWIDGVDFTVPPGAKVMIGITKDGKPNPRHLHIGSSGSSIAPNGWVLAANEIGELPIFKSGKELGHFVGKDTNSNKLISRWNGDGNKHIGTFELMSSSALLAVEGISLEGNDVLTVKESSVEVESVIVGGLDGLDITLSDNAYVGLASGLDGLFQERRVNRGETFGLPNAHYLPLLDPYGKPSYDQHQDKNVFLWKGQDGVWRLRLTAGGDSAKLKGAIVSDKAPIKAVGYLLEPSDRLDTSASAPFRIEFDFTSVNGWQDGVDFEFPESANVSIQFDQSSSDSAGPVLVGEGRWPINGLSLNLSSW